MSKEMHEFTEQLPVDPTAMMKRPNNYSTVIQQQELIVIADTRALQATEEHLIIYTDGLCILKNTVATAWCKNSNTSIAKHLVPARTHGIYQAEYKGLLA